jgi:hypothetical protein
VKVRQTMIAAFVACSGILAPLAASADPIPIEVKQTRTAGSSFEGASLTSFAGPAEMLRQRSCLRQAPTRCGPGAPMISTAGSARHTRLA